MPNSIQMKEKEMSIAQKTKTKKLDQQPTKHQTAMQTLYNLKSLNDKNASFKQVSVLSPSYFHAVYIDRARSK